MNHLPTLLRTTLPIWGLLLFLPACINSALDDTFTCEPEGAVDTQGGRECRNGLWTSQGNVTRDMGGGTSTGGVEMGRVDMTGCMETEESVCKDNNIACGQLKNVTLCGEVRATIDCDLCDSKQECVPAARSCKPIDIICEEQNACGEIMVSGIPKVVDCSTRTCQSEGYTCIDSGRCECDAQDRKSLCSMQASAQNESCEPANLTLVDACGEMVKCTLEEYCGSSASVCSTSDQKCCEPSPALACDQQRERLNDKGWCGVSPTNSCGESINVACFACDDPNQICFQAQDKCTPVLVVEKSLPSSKEDLFGSSLAMNDELLVGGSPGTGSGEVFSFGFDASTYQWGARRLLTAPDAPKDVEGFGRAIALDPTQNVLAVSALYKVKGKQQGRIYLYKWESGSWISASKPLDAPKAGNESFGQSISLNSKQLLVGNPDEKSALLYQLDAANNATLERTFENEAANFGASVSMGQDALAISSISDQLVVVINSDPSQANPWEDGKTRQQVIRASDISAGGNRIKLFGASLALDGTTLAIGAPDSDVKNNQGQDQPDAGIVYTWEYKATQWMFEAEVKATETKSGDKVTRNHRFGTSLSMKNSTLVVGAAAYSSFDPVNYTERAQSGARSFRYQGGNWITIQSNMKVDEDAANNQLTVGWAVAQNSYMYGVSAIYHGGDATPLGIGGRVGDSIPPKNHSVRLYSKP